MCTDWKDILSFRASGRALGGSRHLILCIMVMIVSYMLFVMIQTPKPIFASVTSAILARITGNICAERLEVTIENI